VINQKYLLLDSITFSNLLFLIFQKKVFGLELLAQIQQPLMVIKISK